LSNAQKTGLAVSSIDRLLDLIIAEFGVGPIREKTELIAGGGLGASGVIASA
jgi:hypothetical protein